MEQRLIQKLARLLKSLKGGLPKKERASLEMPAQWALIPQQVHVQPHRQHPGRQN
jgi:hypothetical protein